MDKFAKFSDKDAESNSSDMEELELSLHNLSIESKLSDFNVLQSRFEDGSWLAPISRGNLTPF